MRLGTVEHGTGTAVAVRVSETEAALLPELVSLDQLLGVGAGAAAEGWREAAEAAAEGGERVATESLRWLPPVRRPGKVICVALNNSANLERIASGPSTPAMFTKPATSLVGHGRPIVMKPRYGKVHPEPEMVVVLGSGGSEISVDDAMSHVFGYTIINDLTSPSMRGEDTFHYRAIHSDPDAADGIRYVDSWATYPARYKGSDTFGPIGPWVATADEIPDPHALRITCSHDGELVTDDSTENLRFSVAEVISYASEFMTLEAGDLIAMGTAFKRTGGGRAVQNVDLQQGGVSEVTVERIGTLANPVEHR